MKGGNRKPPWLITCVSGRSFIVYAFTAIDARSHFKKMILDEMIVSVMRDAPEATIV